MPWLLWSFERQSWPDKELVVVDSSEAAFAWARPGVRVLSAPPGTNIARKRNLALVEARGEYIAWFDDDDWQHPRRLSELLVPLLSGAAELAGATSSWFIDLWKGRCAPYHPTGVLIFNSCVMRSDLARTERFDERIERGSDTPWMAALSRRAGSRLTAIPRKTYSAWLCHDRNISNPSTQRRCLIPLTYLRDTVGVDAWGDTDREIDRLRSRLAGR